ncbi:hypothetical protein KKH18_10330 [bacterium]|nr:hypothetical protein [bacterium]
MNDLKQKKIDRFRFLKEVYDQCADESPHFFNHRAVGEKLGFDWDYTKTIMDYLVGEMLVEWKSNMHSMLTHWGLKEIEEAIDSPDEETDHFLPYSVVINYGTIQSQHVEGSGNVASQTSSRESSDMGELVEFLNELKADLSRIVDNTDEQKQIIADIKTILIQASAPNPDKSIIGSLVKKIVNGLNSVGGALALEWVKKLAGF